MAKRRFEFLTYRINIVEQPELLDGAFPKRLKSDEDLLAVLEQASLSKHDLTRQAQSAVYKWSVRDCENFKTEDPTIGWVATIDLARSTILKGGRIVTDEGVVDGDSQAQPPLASVVRMFFFFRRHLVAAEYNSEIMASNAWLDVLTSIVANAANAKDFNSWFELEPIPTESEVIKAFNAFDRLVRMKVHLRLPNPDLSRFTKKLHDELRAGGIQDYIQDMKNPSGLNRETGNLPFASAAMAQAGYKKGEVRLEGPIDGKYERVDTGKHAARGAIEIMKDFVRALKVNRRTKEAKAVLAAISEELERISPPDKDHS